MKRARSYIRFVLLISVLSCLWGCTSTSTHIAPPPITTVIPDVLPTLPEVRQDLYHEVAPMETLWRIAKMYNVDQQAIVSANRLRNPSAISVGQKLLIPDAAQQRSVIPLYKNRPWTHIVVHHSATEAGNALTIDRAHHHRGFWDGLGYHFLIDNGTVGKRDGQIEVGPRWIKQKNGAHCNAAGMNENGIGICLVGNFSEGQPSHKQMESLIFLVNTLKKHYKIPEDHILRHDDVPGKSTECPGTRFPWRDFLSRLTRS